MARTDLEHKPKNIVVDVENGLMQINWADGHTSVYEFTTLRRACPCAGCRPWVHGVGAVGDSPQAVRSAIGELHSVKDVNAVGGYAINFHWADGHDSGIYSFEYLRSICTCEEHTSGRPGVDDE
jgi:DUF971 family protein